MFHSFNKLSHWCFDYNLPTDNPVLIFTWQALGCYIHQADMPYLQQLTYSLTFSERQKHRAKESEPCRSAKGKLFWRMWLWERINIFILAPFLFKWCHCLECATMQNKWIKGEWKREGRVSLGKGGSLAPILKTYGNPPLKRTGSSWLQNFSLFTF